MTLIENSVWKRIAIHPVGGLVQVGFAKETDLLLVLSSDGRGIFNCLTGDKLARDRTDYYEFFNEETLLAKGFDLLEGEEIETAGLFGGSLSTKTQDGWELSIGELNYRTDGIYLSLENTENQMLIGDNGAVEIKTFGFSQTEKSFVVATSADLTIFSRQL